MSTFARVENLTAEEMEHFGRYAAQYRPKLTVTGEAIREEWETGAETHVILKGSWTPYGVMRDCGDHYIIARWSRYDWVSKDLTEIRYDVDDK